MTNTLLPTRYDRSVLKPRILHLGFGAFARAHPMVYLHQGLEKLGGDWGVVAARLHSGREALDALDAARGLYHVAEADGETVVLRKIGVLTGTCHPTRDGAGALPALIATPELEVILLTITEKGYCTTGGTLDLAHSGIKADLSGLQPSTAIGVIVAGLRQRRAAGLGGLTILSCDNQPHNGDLTRTAVHGFAEILDPDLAQWIADEVRFPSSMVDRIVPAMTEGSRSTVEEALGASDPNAILCEPFRQWVIENNFARAAPPFAAGGALLVADVQPFEEMKLRLLNGSHTALAWIGQLLGYETVADCMGDAALKAVVHRLMLSEQAPTLNLPTNMDIQSYAEDLLTRFGNTQLKHRLVQIAGDSSQKMPQRLFAPIAANLAAARDWPVAALAIAAWIEGLRALPPIDDPRQSELRAAAVSDDPVLAVLSCPALLPSDLVDQGAFIAGVQDAYRALQRGAAGAVADLAASAQS